MKRTLFVLPLCLFVFSLSAQLVTQKLAQAWTDFESDSQMNSALASLYVIDEETGSVVFDRNAKIGLAPASTQKIITAAAAYDLLGKSFRFQTKFGYYGGLKSGRLNGSLVVFPGGDPTLGSWRWLATTEDSVVQRVTSAIAKTGIQSFRSFVVDESGLDEESIPGGWVWDDVGNYYGAGAAALNWRENQYDLILKSGVSVGDPVSVVGTKPSLYKFRFALRLKAAAKGSGDNSIIYLPLGADSLLVRGTIPVGEDRFVVSGAMPSPQLQFLSTLTDALAQWGISKEFSDTTISDKRFANNQGVTFFHTETSQPLDSMSYWFLKRSINLYGEALAKAIALKSGKPFTSEDGAATIAKYWSDKGIDIQRSELNTYDGSGLSPLNRTTTHAQVTVLQYAKKQPWFEGYFAGFPEFNGMKLKSGTISRVKSFCGYHTSKEGRRYIVSFIVNNYNGPVAALVQKMYKVLDVLK